MKLYGTDLSPYAERCLMQFVAKGLDVEFLPAPGGLKSDEYAALNPMQRIPALETDEGVCLPESEVICEYIEDLYPTPPLRPDAPVERALMRTLSRIVDTYHLPSMGPLFMNMKPETRDDQAVDKGLETVGKSLDYLERYIGDNGFAVGNALSLADCTLVSTLNFSLPFVGRFGLEAPLKGRPKLERYWDAIRTQPAAEVTIKRMQEAFAKAHAEGRF